MALSVAAKLRAAAAGDVSSAPATGGAAAHTAAKRTKPRRAVGIGAVEGGDVLAYKSELGRIDAHGRKLSGRTVRGMKARRVLSRRFIVVALAVVAAPLLIALRFGDQDSNTVDWP